MQAAADQVSETTGGKLDLLLNNAGFVSDLTAFKNLTEFEPDVLEKDLMSSFHVNVVGVAHTTNAFLPLIRKGEWKKVITISTGMADNDLTNGYGVDMAGPYAASKAAVNTLVAKYNAAFGKSEGILFLAISPGAVDTLEGKQFNEEEMAGL